MLKFKFLGFVFHKSNNDFRIQIIQSLFFLYLPIEERLIL